MNRREQFDCSPTEQQIKDAHALVRDEIVMGRNVIGTKTRRLDEAVAKLNAAFADGRYAEIKQASEAVRAVARDLSVTAGQVEGLAGSLVKTMVLHLNSRGKRI